MSKTDTKNDLSSAAGAAHLCERINAYWRERGFDPNARPVRLPYRPAMRSTSFAIKSDLVAGQPPRKSAPRPTYRPEPGR